MSELLQKTRVFWHEFGHYTAQRFNKLHFGGLGTAHLKICRQKLPNQRIDYDGGIQPIAPPGYTPLDKIKNPAAMVASNVYGCFFQCRRYLLPWNGCFGPEHTGVHGFKDHEKVNRVLRECLPDAESRDLVERCIANFFEALHKRPEFEELFKVDISDLIASNDDIIDIDLNELEVTFSAFFKAHEDFYIKFVHELDTIFSKY